MKYLKIFDEVGNHIEYYDTDSTEYPNVGAYRENVLTSPIYNKIYFYKDDPTPNIEIVVDCMNQWRRSTMLSGMLSDQFEYFESWSNCTYYNNIEDDCWGDGCGDTHHHSNETAYCTLKVKGATTIPIKATCSIENEETDPFEIINYNGNMSNPYWHERIYQNISPSTGYTEDDIYDLPLWQDINIDIQDRSVITDISLEYSKNYDGVSGYDRVFIAIPKAYIKSVINECTMTHDSCVETNKRFWVDTAWGWMEDNTLNPLPTRIHSMYVNTNGNSNASNDIELLCVYFEGYDEFSVLVRSYAESNFDYVVVSQLNVNRDTFLTEVQKNNETFNTSLIKLRTRGKQISNTTIDAYQLVVFSGCNTNITNHIWVAYRKDGSVDSGLDMGYLLIPNDPDTFETCGDAFVEYCNCDGGDDCDCGDCDCGDGCGYDEDGDGCDDMDCDGDCDGGGCIYDDDGDGCGDMDCDGDDCDCSFDEDGDGCDDMDCDMDNCNDWIEDCDYDCYNDDW